MSRRSVKDICNEGIRRSEAEKESEAIQDNESDIEEKPVDHFTFFRSYRTQFDLLTNDRLKVIFIEGITDYVFNGVPHEETVERASLTTQEENLLLMAFCSIEHNLDKSIDISKKRAIAGAKGGKAKRKSEND